uniref:hypothetical protein n=1 Tax=Nocardioides dongkuii TaxID=2760089 RepID=UPI001D0C0F35
ALAAREAAEADAAEHARLRAGAEAAADQRAVDRQAVEASVRHQAELVEAALEDRLAAEERAADLAHQLEEARGRLLGGGAGDGNPADDRRRRGLHAKLPVTPVAPVAGDEAADEAPITFQRRPQRRSLSLVLLGAAALAALATAYLAVTDEPLAPAAITGAVVTLVLLVTGLVARSSSGYVTVAGGVVEIVDGERHHRFDLTSDGTVLEVHGTPGQRGWRVDFVRRSLPPITVDARMVDPVAFTQVLRRWRPDL